MATRLSCSECLEGWYVCATEGEGTYRCENCDHRIDYKDFDLDCGEVLVMDDDGYVAVEMREECSHE